jgi:hypothetical protein
MLEINARNQRSKSTIDTLGQIHRSDSSLELASNSSLERPPSTFNGAGASTPCRTPFAHATSPNL